MSPGRSSELKIGLHFLCLYTCRMCIRKIQKLGILAIFQTFFICRRPQLQVKRTSNFSFCLKFWFKIWKKEENLSCILDKPLNIIKIIDI